MKECQFCHGENADNAVFCKNCGKRLDGKFSVRLAEDTSTATARIANSAARE